LSDLVAALAAVEAGEYLGASRASQASRAAAEAAFLHPSVLAQLNYPESHKLGVYMPLFLPVSVPLLQGLMIEVVRGWKRRRQYLATRGS